MRNGKFRFLLLVLTAFLSLPSGECQLRAQISTEYLQRGREFASREQWKEAEEQFRLYLQKNPASSEATVLHSMALIHLNQPFDAVLELEALLAADPNSVPALKLYAGLLDSVVRDRAKAEEVLANASALAPKDPEIWKALGNFYLGQQKTDQAVRSFMQAVSLTPSDPLLIAGLGFAYGQGNDMAHAALRFAQALKINDALPKPNPRVYFLFAQYLVSQNRPAESLPLFSKALASDPHFSDAYYGRAVANEKLRDFTRAEADALASLAVSNRRKDSHQLLLRIYRQRGDQEKLQKEVEAIEQLAAEENSQQALARNVRLSLRTGESLLRQGRFADAVKPYEEIVRALPTFYEAYFALGICYTQTNRLPEAEVSLKKYLSFQPLSADGHAALGVLFLQQNRIAAAQQELKRAIELDPSLTEARKALVQIDSLNRH